MPYIKGETIREKLNRETQFGVDEARLRCEHDQPDATGGGCQLAVDVHEGDGNAEPAVVTIDAQMATRSFFALSFARRQNEAMTWGCRASDIVRRGHLRPVRRAEQTMGMPALRHHWSAAQVRALIEESPLHWPRYELMGGELIVTPAPGGIHQVAVMRILVLLTGYLAGEPLGVALSSPADLQLLPDTIAQPDIFVAPRVGPAADDHVFSWADIATLLLALEVISPSSSRTDRVEKRDYYMSAGVPEYWVVDVDARVVERWNPDRATPMVCRSVLEWRPVGASEPLTIDLVRLFNEIWGDFRAIGGGGSAAGRGPEGTRPGLCSR